MNTDAAHLKGDVRRRDGMKKQKADVEKMLKLVYAEARNGEISEIQFIEKVAKILSF